MFIIFVKSFSYGENRYSCVKNKTKKSIMPFALCFFRFDVFQLSILNYFLNCCCAVAV